MGTGSRSHRRSSIAVFALWVALALACTSPAGAAISLNDRVQEHLGDGEAVDLFARVFGPYMQTAGNSSPLPNEIKRFVSDYAAVVEDDGQPQLIESTTPLRTAMGNGRLRPVDFRLVRGTRGLRPRNPLVSAVLPTTLGQGLRLPSFDLGIHLPDADPDATPFVVRRGVAVYPNAERDTSFAVVPLPTGLETFSMLHSPSAPHVQRFLLDMPEGAELRGTAGGGAEITLSGRTLVAVPPPAAVDANGSPVPVELETRGRSLVVEATPSIGTAYPILVDPIYQVYSWAGGSTTGLSDWTKTSNTTAYTPATQLNCGSNCVAPFQTSGTPGLYVGATSGSVVAGSTAYWSYFVPRYQSDKSLYGKLPTSFISSAEFSSTMFFHRSDASASPALFGGLWGSSEAPYWGGPNHWVSQVIRYGNQSDWTGNSFTLSNAGNNPSAKWLMAGLAATDNHSVTAYRDAYFGGVKVGLTDLDKPVLSGIVAPTGWFDQFAAAPIPATAEDTGLGVFSFTSKETVAPFNSWQYSLGCSGTSSSPCPRVWKTSEGSPVLLAWPSALPEGLSKIAVTVSDPVGNVSETSYVDVKIDHSAPTVSLTGPLTEPGSKRLDPGKYELHVAATDGTSGAPRSGVKSIAIEVDGTVVPGTVEQACPAGSCSASRDWTFDVSGYSNGEHVVAVVVKDHVGRQAKSEVKVTVDKSRIYWGSWISGEVALMPREGEEPPRGDAPWDAESWELFEQHAGGKKTSIVHFGQPPPWILHEEEGTYFHKGPLELASKHGAIGLMDMRSDAKSYATHVSLDQITAGTVDEEIEAWAEAVKAFAKPFFFRWNWEMNLTGEDFIWAKEAAEEPSDYVDAWKHFHDVATEVGATNITWVWCPNVKYPGSTPLNELWPGGEYVDWTCLDGYNWGTNPLQPDSWKSLKAVFGPTYEDLLTLAPSKPIMIGETASTEAGGNKAEWITNALTKELLQSLPKVKAFVWFNWNDKKGSGRMDWPIESSEAAEKAFAAGVASPNFAAGGKEFESLPALTPIQPLP